MVMGDIGKFGALIAMQLVKLEVVAYKAGHVLVIAAVIGNKRLILIS